MKKETIKTIGNTLLYAGVTSLAVWETWEVCTLKRNMKFYAEALEKAKGLIEQANTRIDRVLFPTVYETEAGKEYEILCAAGLDLATALGDIEFVKEECASK